MAKKKNLNSQVKQKNKSIFKSRGRKKVMGKTDNEFTKLLERYKYSDEYIASRLGMVRRTFASKRKRPRSLTVQEVHDLSLILGVERIYLTEIIMGETKLEE